MHNKLILEANKILHFFFHLDHFNWEHSIDYFKLFFFSTTPMYTLLIHATAAIAGLPVRQLKYKFTFLQVLSIYIKLIQITSTQNIYI